MANPGYQPVEVRTKFLRLSQPAALGYRIDGWTVCWLGGWDKGKVFFLIMLKKVIRLRKKTAVNRVQRP
jgi:hypothetical protein